MADREWQGRISMVVSEDVICGGILLGRDTVGDALHDEQRSKNLRVYWMYAPSGKQWSSRCPRLCSEDCGSGAKAVHRCFVELGQAYVVLARIRSM